MVRQSYKIRSMLHVKSDLNVLIRFYLDSNTIGYLLVGQGRYRVPICRTLKILITPPPLTSQINFDITIMFPAPKLVYTDIYMVGVPYF